LPVQRQQSNRNGVVFDLDGTLIDSLADLANSSNEVLAGMGYPVHAHDAYRYFVGEGIVLLMARALPAQAAADPRVLERCVGAVRKVYARRCREHTRPYPGIKAMLAELGSRGVPFAVLSNKPDYYTRRLVRELFGRFPFAAVVGARDDVPRKPSPVSARRVAARMQLPAHRCLLVGDTPTDLATARSAGMLPVGVEWGFRDRRELLDAGAAVVLARPSGLIGLA
jgi:phosphoglycolate phosphatase